MKEGVIIPLSFVPTPLFFALLHSNIYVCVDATGFFYKQTFRNRANVLSPNRVTPLVVSVKSGRKYGVPLNTIEIDYRENWIHKHLKALETYYYSSPFYEVLAKDIEGIYQKKYRLLIELNKAFVDYMMQLLDLQYNGVAFEYEHCDCPGCLDIRKVYSPKRDYMQYFVVDYLPYYQVYGEKFGFVPELSLFDLLFNLGSEAGMYLRKMAATLKIVNK